MAGHMSGYRCTLCNTVFPVNNEELTTCPECGEKGILDILYDYSSIKKVFTKEILKKSMDDTIWRYTPLLPVKGKPQVETLSVGMTPLYRSKNLEENLGIAKIYMKDDGLNPTGSLKDRASLMAVAKALENGQKTICCSSTGNAASSLAGNAAKVGLKTIIFVPKRAPQGKLAQLLIYGSNLMIVDGDYKKTYEMSKAAIDYFDFYNRNAALNPFLVEGKKTVAYEIMEQLEFEPTDWIVVTVGDGCTIGGVYKGLYDLYNIGFIPFIPKILGVQASGCNPFVEAFANESTLSEADENTLADSIAVGIPRNPVKGMTAVSLSKGSFIDVSDEEILEAMQLLGRMEGVFAEPASGAGLAGLKKGLEQGVIKSAESVTLINTGNGLKDVVNGLKAVDMPSPINPDQEQIIELIKKMKAN